MPARIRIFLMHQNFDVLVTGGVWIVFECMWLPTPIVFRTVARTNFCQTSGFESMLQLPPTFLCNVVNILRT